MTRRRFLRSPGSPPPARWGLGATRVDWPQLLDAAAAYPLDPAAGVLVVVTLYGGNDGLNTVVPAADPAYQAARPELAYRPDEVLDLGEGLGLNPGMTGLKSCGTPTSWPSSAASATRSPTAATSARWPSGRPPRRSPVTTGWLGRWLDATTTDPLAAVSLDVGVARRCWPGRRSPPPRSRWAG